MVLLWDVIGFISTCESLQINKDTRPLYVSPGQPVYLHCITPPLPGVTYTWRTNAGKISHHPTFPNGTLVIRSYNITADKGGYECEVSKQCRPEDTHIAAHIDLDVASKSLHNNKSLSFFK